MTQLVLILGINVAGLALSLSLGRWLVGRDAGGSELRRLTGAVERASVAFLWREYRLVAAGAGGLALGLVGLHALAGGDLPTAFWAAIAVLLGAGATCLTAHAAAHLSRHGSARLVTAARSSMDGALSCAIRAGGAAGLLVETVSALGTALLFGLLYAKENGFAMPSAAASWSAALLLPGFAFGAVAAALVLQRGGSIYHVAADVGGDLAGERDAGLEHDDARNPAVVSDLVGDHVGLAAPRAADLFVSATIANVAAVVVATRVQSENSELFPVAIGVALLPLVIRAFGVIASAFGVLVVRSDELAPAAALWRGQAATVIISLSGVAGGTLWLLGDSYWVRFFAAGALGILAATLAAHATRYQLVRRFGPLRDVIDALRAGDAPTVAQGIGGGLQAALVPTALVGVAMAAAARLGEGSELVMGTHLALAVALTAVLSAAPYALAIASFSPIADSAGGLMAVTPAGLGEEAQRRISRLDDASASASLVAQTYLVVSGALAGLLAAAALHFAHRASNGATGVALDVAHPSVVWSGALGSAVVLAYAGSAARAAARAARGVALEVERQLRGFAREHGLAQVPADYTPSYRACIDVTARAALERLLMPVIVTLLLPVLLGFALHVTYRNTEPGLVTQGLTAFVIVASVTGFGAALAVDGAHATFGAARRASRPRGVGSGFAASVGADAVGDVLGNSSGPAAHLLFKGAAVTALLVAPFFTS